MQVLSKRLLNWIKTVRSPYVRIRGTSSSLLSMYRGFDGFRAGEVGIIVDQEPLEPDFYIIKLNIGEILHFHKANFERITKEEYGLLCY